MAAYQPVRAPRGKALTCHGWQQEAALRMLINSLDPEVAERPEELIASGGAGKPARDWESFWNIVDAVRKLGDDQTLLVQAGAPAGVRHTHAGAARVLIAGSEWSYVGTQGVLPTAYELFSRAAHWHFGGTLAGKLVVSGGMGGMGGAVPLAVTANGGAFLGIDVDTDRIKRRVKTGYCDLLVNSLDEALRILKNAVRRREAASVGLIGNCADVIPELARRGVVPDLLTDQTPATDPGDDLGDNPRSGYLPQGLTAERARELRRHDASGIREAALDAIAAHVRAMLDLQKLGAVVFEYGNQIRAAAHGRGVQNAYDIADGVKEYLLPVMRGGRAPLLLVALSGEARDILRSDKLALELFPTDESLRKWMEVARRLPRFQGLPARGYWLQGVARARLGVALNQLVARGEIAGPMAMVCGSAEAPLYQATGTHASADDAFPEALLKTNSGTAWMRTGGDSGAHILSWALVADGTPQAQERIERATGGALTNE